MSKKSFKERKKTVWDSLVPVSKKEGASLLRKHLVREITKEMDVPPLSYRYYLLDDGRVVRNNYVDPPEMPIDYYIFSSLAEVIHFLILENAEVKKIEAFYKLPPSPAEVVYGVSKSSLDSLMLEDKLQISEYLDLPQEQLDYTPESLNKMDNKLQGLQPYKIEQIIQLLNIYACKALAKEKNGFVFPTETANHTYSLDVIIHGRRYSPLRDLARQLNDEPDEYGFSVGYSVSFAPVMD